MSLRLSAGHSDGLSPCRYKIAAGCCPILVLIAEFVICRISLHRSNSNTRRVTRVEAETIVVYVLSREANPAEIRQSGAGIVKHMDSIYLTELASQHRVPGKASSCMGKFE